MLLRLGELTPLPTPPAGFGGRFAAEKGGEWERGKGEGEGAG